MPILCHVNDYKIVPTSSEINDQKNLRTNQNKKKYIRVCVISTFIILYFHNRSARAQLHRSSAGRQEQETTKEQEKGSTL